MANVSPFLRFNDGKCREAMNFYKDCLGGTLDFMTVGTSPMAKDMSADKHDLIMHSTLSKGSWVLIGSDMMRDKAVIGDNVGVSLDCDSEKEIQDVFGKLSKGGEVFMAPEEQFWGGVFGMVTDKYGVEWMLNFQKKPLKK
jgi:PhnB protein